MKHVERFLRELAKGWEHPSKPTLCLIGSTALMLRAQYERGTKDSDILETAELDHETRQQLLALGGRNSKIADRWRLYLEVVPPGLPFLPQAPRWHPVEIEGAPDTLRFKALDVVDVVVSKLARFNPNDRSDVSAMVERDLVPHGLFLERFRSAVDVFSCDARAEDLPRYVRNLQEVERDMLGVNESEIDLPGWIS